jgi:hypothetical protein
MSKYLLIIAFSLLSFSAIAVEANDIDIPDNVEWMFVFLQNPETTKRGSGEEIATLITRQEFLEDFTRYKNTALAKKWNLIVTAETKDERWIQTQISYKGKKLEPAPYYNPGIDKVVEGAKIPLD